MLECCEWERYMLVLQSRILLHRVTTPRALRIASSFCNSLGPTLLPSLSLRCARSSNMASSARVRLAILDDYEGVAASKFEEILPASDIESFPETFVVADPEQKRKSIERLKPFTVISTMRERTGFPADVVAELPNLKLLMTTGMKNASIDMTACAKHNIVVTGAKGAGRTDRPARTSTPPSSLDSTMEHTWALILGIARNVARDDLVVKNGGWQTGFATGLTGKTLGLLGLGKLGADTAKVGVLAFGMKITAWSNSLTQETADEKAKGYGLPAGTFHVVSSKEELFKVSDIVSVHYVLSDRSRGMVGEPELAAMKNTALLVNTSRGPLIDEKALLATLKAGKIRGAALDVYDTEPLPKSSAWRSTEWGKNGSSAMLLSPHMGYVEEGVMKNWYNDQVEVLGKWLEGKPAMYKIN